jgi:hypothetical protein
MACGDLCRRADADPARRLTDPARRLADPARRLAGTVRRQAILQDQLGVGRTGGLDDHHGRPAARQGVIIGAHPGRPGAARSEAAPRCSRPRVQGVVAGDRTRGQSCGPEARGAGSTPSGPRDLAPIMHIMSTGRRGPADNPFPGCRVDADSQRSAAAVRPGAAGEAPSRPAGRPQRADEFTRAPRSWFRTARCTTLGSLLPRPSQAAQEVPCPTRSGPSS